MSDSLEVLFVSDTSDTPQSICCIDPEVGTTLMTYKGGNRSSKNCLCVIGKDYLLSTEEAKPILHVWPLNHQEPCHELKMVLPGKPSSLSVSSDGAYCVGGIDGKIYVWLISSGHLLNVISRHYQAINKIAFTDDSSHFVTAGEDGLVLVWKLANVVAKQWSNNIKFSNNQIDPVYNFSQHSLPVTDIFIGHGSLKARLFTASVDQTCKIFCLSSGTLLLSLVFSHVLTCLTVNDLETALFVGTNSGKIHVIDLDPYPRTLEHHIPENVMGTFIGHTSTVNCLSTSINGVTLASGADDGKVFIWDIASKQLIRSLQMKGSVSNMFFYSVVNNIFSNKFNPSVVLSRFEKISNTEEENLEMNVWVHQSMDPISFESTHRYEGEEKTKEISEKTSEDENVEALGEEIIELKEINKELYQFAINKILKNPLGISISNQDNHQCQNSFEEAETE